MTLGERIRMLREKNKLTQTELSKKLGIPNQNLSNYERGFRHPDYEALQKIADFFDVSVDYLLGRREKTKNPLDLKDELMENEMAHWDGVPLTEEQRKYFFNLFSTIMERERELKQNNSK